jgi:hypothetical protein
MMIVIEGPDGAGKTTLAKQLAADLKLEYHHEGPPPKNISPLDHYGRVLEDFRRNKTDVVIDRFAYGERVYGPILRGKDNLGHVGWKLVLRLMRACSVVPIYCLPEFGECYTNWSSGRPELIKNAEQFKRTYDLWQHHIKTEMPYRAALYDYTKWSYPELLHYVRRRLIGDNAHTYPVGVIGSPLAKFLFVGDVGSNPRAHVDLPFWSDRGSSEYLNDALTVAGFHENDIALVNSRRHDGRTQEIPIDFGWWQIIALGRNASRELAKSNIPHKTVPHPQYWKRFHHADIKGYANKLRKSAGRA